MFKIHPRHAGTALGATFMTAGLWLVFMLYREGHLWLALAGLALLAGSAAIFSMKRAYALRYLYPGAAAILVFVILPALYTVGIGFTNYSSSNLLSYERATSYLLEQTYAGDGDPLRLQLYRQNSQYRLTLSRDDGAAWRSAPIKLNAIQPASQKLALQATAGQNTGEKLALKDVIALQPALRQLTLTLPGQTTPYRLSSLSGFSPAKPLYLRQADGALLNQQSGETLRPDFERGFYRNAQGENIVPGFRVNVGWKNFRQLFANSDLQKPMLKVFAWTVTFSALTVLFTFALGLMLATVLSWEALRFRGVYRVLLFLPYAVPGFISILIFRGLFNENFGEINLVLNGLFGIRPSWFSDPLLAKAMLLIVNTWLGYPYMMLLCLGLIKSIPSDLYEASAINGASAWTNLTQITLPLILKPIMPLLIASFAFNFNNFVLISLLTDGRPDFIDSAVPAGTTDILVSYTYRIAFQDSGQNFGLAAAISTLIFALVAALSLINLRLSRINAQANR
ncbi:maltose ABC transporter permease MalF [Chromobacterium alticapitis]|uniref:Maltose/maltodextrin transport system permease protein n=1 Tax=Chromobacterium alticapitis TaxID=2073169 RepID=A0A2S5DK16_9NEIS|nr:maltose ABC transporter permease MalF [Chromobacterium alticapitis]POZ63423.1 maltose ABC transporter permease MalF [Chromobacterium alticapitis]